MKIVESNEGKSGWEVPPKDMKRRARVLGRANNMHHQGVKRKGWGDMNLDYDQRVVMDCRAPLKIMERTNEKRGHSEAGIQC